MHSAVVW